MAAPPTGPCELWVTPEELEECPERLPQGYTQDDLLVAATLASQNLYRFSGRQYGGQCTDHVRPCVGINTATNGQIILTWLVPRGFPYPTLPVHTTDGWQNIGCSGAGCWVPCVFLPGPVSDITEVRVDGQVLTKGTDYKVSGYSQLCRTDGQLWPIGQDMTKELTEDGTFYVEWTRGKPIDIVQKRMAREYALQRIIHLLCTKMATCDVSNEGVVTLSADGVSAAFDSFTELAAAGKTGIKLVDEWLGSVNPYGRKRRAIVGRADAHSRHGRKWTTP